MSRNQNTTEVKGQEQMSATGLKSKLKCIMGAGINNFMLNDSRLSWIKWFVLSLLVLSINRLNHNYIWPLIWLWLCMIPNVWCRIYATGWWTSQMFPSLEVMILLLLLWCSSTMRLKCCWEWSHQPDRISCHRSTLTSRVKRLTCRCEGVVCGVVPRTATVWGRMTTRVIAQQKERWLKADSITVKSKPCLQ